MDASGHLKPTDQWTTRFVALLADWVRTWEAGRALPYWCWGHSAGGQFLSRVAAFEQIVAERIIIANSSSYVLLLLGSYPGGDKLRAEAAKALAASPADAFRRALHGY